jgi:hypothetical protein
MRVRQRAGSETSKIESAHEHDEMACSRPMTVLVVLPYWSYSTLVIQHSYPLEFICFAGAVDVITVSPRHLKR